MPSSLIIHRTHLDIFDGESIPSNLDARDAGDYLFQLYRRFGASTTVPIQTQEPSSMVRHGSSDWAFDTLEDAKARIRLWAEQNSPKISPRLSLDVIIPSYRVTLDRLSKVLALRPSSTCITAFIIIVDNPQSPYAYKLKHSYSHRTDVRILVNEYNQGASASRNRGLLKSTSEWVAFLDDDVDPSPNYLVAAERHIRNQPDAAGFVGNTYFPAPCNIFTTAIRFSGVTSFWNIADKIAEDVPWGITANLIIRRNVCDEVLFDLRFPKTSGSEDIDFCINMRKESLQRGGTGFWAAPDVVVAHPWWNEGRRSYARFFNWGRGDGALIKMHPDLSWCDVTPNSAETFFLAALLILTGTMLFSESTIRLGISLAISNLFAHVLHDAHRHVVRENAEGETMPTSLGPVGRAIAIFEGALIRLVNEMGRLVGIVERKEWESIGKRFDWFTGGSMGINEERSGGIERAGLILGMCFILSNMR